MSARSVTVRFLQFARKCGRSVIRSVTAEVVGQLAEALKDWLGW